MSAQDRESSSSSVFMLADARVETAARGIEIVITNQNNSIINKEQWRHKHEAMSSGSIHNSCSRLTVEEKDSWLGATRRAGERGSDGAKSKLWSKVANVV